MFPVMITSAPNSPTAFAKASATPERIPGRMFGRTMRRKVVASDAPSECAACSSSGSSSCSTGWTVRTTNGSVTNMSASTIAVLRVRDVDADRRGRAVEREQREAGDDRGQGEREIDHGVDDRLPAEVVAYEHPRGDGPEHGVHERDDERGAEGQLQRGDGLPGSRSPPRTSRPLARRLPDEGGDRQQDHQRQEGRDDAEGQGRCGPVPRARARRGRSSATLSQCSPPTLRSIPTMIPVFGSKNCFCTFFQPPRPGASIVNSPGRAGNFFRLRSSTLLTTGR